jgi:hypothetical protein
MNGKIKNLGMEDGKRKKKEKTTLVSTGWRVTHRKNTHIPVVFVDTGSCAVLNHQGQQLPCEQPCVGYGPYATAQVTGLRS